jgi:hypothetical protein
VDWHYRATSSRSRERGRCSSSTRLMMAVDVLAVDQIAGAVPPCHWSGMRTVSSLDPSIPGITWRSCEYRCEGGLDSVRWEGLQNDGLVGRSWRRTRVSHGG